MSSLSWQVLSDGRPHEGASLAAAHADGVGSCCACEGVARSPPEDVELISGLWFATCGGVIFTKTGVERGHICE